MLKADCRFSLTMKTIKALIFALLCAAGVQAQTWDGTVATSYAGGDGSKESPYLICNGSELAKLAEDVSTIANFSKGKYFKLTADIVMNTGVFDCVVPATRQDKEDLPKDNDISMFRLTPRIGTYNGDEDYMPFQGTFDGDGHTISGLIDALYSGKNYDGLFRMVENGVVKNLGLSDCYSLGNSYCGGIVGRLVNSRLVNCFIVHSYVEQGGSYGGALVGRCQGESYILNCYADCTIYGKNDMGGLVGRIGNGTETPSLIDNCFSYVNLRVKRSNNGAISSELSPGAAVNKCYYIRLGEAKAAIVEGKVKGRLTDTEELTAEQFMADELVEKLNAEAKTLPGAARWKKGEKHPVLSFTEFSSDDLPVSGIRSVATSAPSSRCYNLSGVAITTARRHGLTIVRTTDANGNVVVRKVMK